MIQLRASALPLAIRCPGSVRGDLRVDETNEAADLGTAVHEALRSLVETGAVDWDQAPALARRYGVDENELRMLVGMAVPLWREVEGSFSEAFTETPLEHEWRLVTGERVFLTGHADVMAVSGDAVRVLDWKSGRRDSDYSEQALAYCALGLLREPNAIEASCTLIWIRDGEAEQYTMRRSELDAWVDRLIEVIVRWDGTYRVGEHCRYCKRGHECEARAALVRSAVDAMLDNEAPSLPLARWTPEAKIALLEQADMVAGIAKRVRDAIKDDVREHGDVVSAGKRITIATEERRHLRVLEAWQSIDSRLSDEEKAEVIDISISGVERIVAKNAGKGKGAGAVRALRAELEAAGAIEITTIEKLITRREAS
jgi:hypothetical protein